MAWWLGTAEILLLPKKWLSTNEGTTGFSVFPEQLTHSTCHEIPWFHGNQMFIIVFTKARQWHPKPVQASLHYHKLFT